MIRAGSVLVSIDVRRVSGIVGVPKDRDSMIVRWAMEEVGPVVEIRWRRARGFNQTLDRTIYRKCRSDRAAALQLAVDLALLGKCERVYVLGDAERPSTPRAPGAAR